MTISNDPKNDNSKLSVRIADSKPMASHKHSLAPRLALIFSFTGILLLSLNGLAQDPIIAIPNVMDPVKAEVLGVHLHMTGKEAVAGLEQRLHIKIPTTPYSSKNYVHMSKANMTPGKMFVSFIAIYGDQYGIELGFSESYPFNVNRPESLTSIRYVPNTRTDADRTAFEAHLLQNYGPGLMIGGHPTLEWCTTGTSRPSTNHGVEVEGQLDYSCLWGSAYQPYMHGNGGELMISDESISHKNYELWNATKITTAPPL